MMKTDLDSTERQGLNISRDDLHAIVAHALTEDLGQGDVTTRLTIPADMQARGTFFSKQELVLAGLPVAEEVFRTLDPECQWENLTSDGAKVLAREPLAGVQSKATALLSGERVALNFLQRLSGIATLTHKFKERLAGLETELLDTRKTTPGLRALEKYAVRMGGGRNHRLGLEDGILIKNNHLTLAGGIGATVEAARRQRSSAMKIEVEVRSLVELEEAMTAGAEIVLLDNMTPAEVAECVRRVRGRMLLEVSGGVDIVNVRDYAETRVQRISVGALTHSAPAVDIHFLVEPL